MDLIEPILLGLLGGAIGEFIRVFDLRHRAPRDWPYWIRLRSYWVITGCMVIAGAVLVFLHTRSGTTFVRNPWLAINIGASAPLVLRQLSAGGASTPGPRDPSEVN